MKAKSIKLCAWLMAGWVTLVCRPLQAQDIHFSQFLETPVLVNPALACTRYDTRVIANFRNQWASVTTPYQSYGISIEKAIHHFKKKATYLGTSLTVYSDKAGDGQMKTLNALFGLNVVTRISTYSRLSLGLGGGINYQSLNGGALQWESQFDGYSYNASTPSGEILQRASITQADFTGGIDWHYSKSERYISAQDGVKADIGASVFHYNTPRYSFLNVSNSRQYTKYILHASLDIGLSNARLALVPSCVYMLQGPSQELNAGLMFKFILQDEAMYTHLKKAAAISIGAYYRTGDAVIPSCMLQWDRYAIGISYDFTTNTQLSQASNHNGGLEIALRFNTSPGYGQRVGASFNKPTYK